MKCFRAFLPGGMQLWCSHAALISLVRTLDFLQEAALKVGWHL